MYQLTETISLIEAIWTVVSLVGLGFSTFALKDAIGDRKVSSEDVLSTELDAIVANAGVRNERMNFALLLGFALVGLMALVLPNAGAELVRTVISLVLLSLNMGVVFNTWSNRQDRKKILKGDVQRTKEDYERKTDDRTSFQSETAKTLKRLEDAADKSEAAADHVADELHESQHRADSKKGVPGEAGDAASRSKDYKQEDE